MVAGALASLVLVPAAPRADCLLEETPATTSDNLAVLFPNWKFAPVAAFDITVCTDGDCPGTTACNIVGLTIYNYGTAGGATDLSAVYYNMTCGKTDVWQTMTYAGVWPVGTDNRPAWTWDGDLAWGSDPQYSCASTPRISVFADVGACPTDGAEVTLGLGFNDVLSPAAPGGLMDACGCQVPSYDEARTGRTKYIRYVTKESDVAVVAPGDPVTYTIRYGRPGAAVSSFVITDTLPVNTHFVAGSVVPAPDPGWDPDIGPPMRLRWTLPGGPSGGGGTSELVFKVSVDWGNGEAFEPGSGDAGAMESARLDNTAAVDFVGSGCTPETHVCLPAGAVVRRYVMWMLADQDVLYAPRMGQPDDEITYSIFIRNASTSKAWWDVKVWDTVPAELDAWGSGAGLWDPCVGWTMTPTGCASGAPGRVVNASKTILTWTLDLAPNQTWELQWKARVRAAGVTAGATAISQVSVLALGSPRMAGGSGDARAARSFIHVAPIVLRTMYFSYVGQAADSTKAEGLKINLYPLNRATNFELRKLFYEGAGFAATGGKSATISAFQGTCAGGYIDGGYGGCGLERAPSQYFLPPPAPASPNATLYKLTANAPVLWILMPELGAGGDAYTYLPSTSLSHSGFMHYSYRRCLRLPGPDCSDLPGYGESWVVFNTSLNVAGNNVPGLGTTAHIFKWDLATLTWQYVRGGDIDADSLWMPFAGCSGSMEGHYRIISSDARLLVYQGYGTIGDPVITYAYNEHGNLAPTAENGLKTSQPGGPGTFYAIAHHDGYVNMLVGNADAASMATWRLFHYRPKYPSMAVTGIPPTLAGNAGFWDSVGLRTTDAGLAGPVNPYVFIGGTKLTMGTGATANAWKIEWVSGGAIEVNSGTRMMSDWAGGSVIHTADGKSAGQEFWFHQYTGPTTWALLAFCHSAGMAVQAVSNQGFSATYTSDGPDQCIGFLPLPTSKADAIVYRINLLAAGTPGNLVAMYHNAQYREKFFTAPFVATGTHYEIIAPPVAYAGQAFWITILVLNTSGITKTDYCGTVTFTSTDPGARIEGAAMDTYNFTWSSASACSAPPDENGVKIFLNVILSAVGLQSLAANDTIDGSINGITAINVVGADVKFFKQPRLSVVASGDMVQFQICWSNYSSASAFTFTVTDAVPVGTSYVPEVATNMSCGNTDGVTLGVAYSTSTLTPAPTSSYTELSGTSAADPATRWLRWTVPAVGVQTTGCACFRVRVD